MQRVDSNEDPETVEINLINPAHPNNTGTYDLFYFNAE